MARPDRPDRPDRPALVDQALELRSIGAVELSANSPESPGPDPVRLGIRELRDQLTSSVRRAGGGERIIVTIGGHPVAQLGPVEAPAATVTIDDLVARGLLEPARRSDRPTDPEVAVDSWTGRRLDRALREVRGT